MPEQTFTGSLLPGTKLGKYEVGEQIATGGMAVIYRAYDPTLDRAVAIKQIAPHLAQDERFLERFRTEAQTLAKLSSSQANIVNVHELIQHDSQLFLVMEYVEGTTLRVLMDRGPVPLQTGLGVLLSTALGLRAMHKNGIVHRDLTPANIMMAKDGALKITDFGLIGHSGGKTSLPMGTTKYMAPEMFTGAPVDGRADIYSLGFIAYEMFAGPEKFQEVFRDVLRDDRAQQVRWMHWHSNPALTAPSLKDLQPGIPPLVSKIVERMMEKDPSKRFASADQIIKWLRRIFVMHVQGKSVTQADSESLEKEMDADAAAPAGPPVVRPSGTGQPAAGAMGRPGTAGAPAAGEGAVEKTAPLPVPKWTWKRAAFWAAVIAGPLLVAAIGLLIWHKHTVGLITVEANRIWADAERQYEDGNFEEAMNSFKRIATGFPELPNLAAEASMWAWRARAEWKLREKDWNEAERAVIEAKRLHASSSWYDDFSKRLAETRDIENTMKEVRRAADEGKFEECINLLTTLQSRYDVDLNEDIAKYREKLELREYAALVAKAKDQITNRLWDDAITTLEKARKIRDTAEVVDLIKNAQAEKQYAALMQQLQQAEAAKDWPQVTTLGEAVLALRPSEAIRTRINNANAEVLAEQARTLEKAEAWDAAFEKWTEVLKFNPMHPEALAAVKKAGQQKRIETYLANGRSALRKGEWDAAVASFEELLKLIDPMKDANIKAEAERGILGAKYNRAFRAAREALQRKDFDEAERLAKEAQGYKDTGEVQALLKRTETTRQYTRHLELGKRLMAQGNWVPAIEAFEAAQRIMDTQEVRDLTAECNYTRYTAKAKAYMEGYKDADPETQKKQLTQALSMAKIAQRYRDDEYIRGLIALIQGVLDGLNKQQG